MSYGTSWRLYNGTLKRIYTQVRCMQIFQNNPFMVNKETDRTEKKTQLKKAYKCIRAILEQQKKVLHLQNFPNNLFSPLFQIVLCLP